MWADPWLAWSALNPSVVSDEARVALAGLARSANDRLLVARVPKATVGVGATVQDARRALHAAAAGQVQLAPQALARLMRELRSPEQIETLTEREKDVLHLLGQGQSNKQIARSLRLREETVKTHVSKILHKLGVQSRTQAVLYAMRNGLMSAR